MDDDFKYFLDDEGFGPPVKNQAVSDEKVAKFKEKLPNQLLTYWQEFGFCGFAKGLFWMVDSDEYEDVLEAWIGDTPFMEKDAYYVIARTAFGGLYLYGEKTGVSLFIQTAYSMIYPTNSDSRFMESPGPDFVIRNFFGSKEKNSVTFSTKMKNLFLCPLTRNLAYLILMKCMGSSRHLH